MPNTTTPIITADDASQLVSDSNKLQDNYIGGVPLHQGLVNASGTTSKTETRQGSDGMTATTDENIRIYHTLDLASDISVNFAVLKSAVTSYDSYYLECILPEYLGNECIGSTSVRIDPVDKGNYYYFPLTGITAVQMGDMVEAVLHMTKAGENYVSKIDTYSVATYAYSMLNKSTDSKMLHLCADLLRYGAEAQSYKFYRTDSLVNASMTEKQISYLSNTDSLTFTRTDSLLGDLPNPKISWVGKALDLGSKVGIKFVFNTKNYSGSVANLSMKVSYIGGTGETKTTTLTGAKAYGSNGYYYSFTFYGLLASELRTIVDATIFEGETQLSDTLRYSAESYAANSTIGNLASLCKALFTYSDSARTFFSPVSTTYSVIFKDWDGTVLKTEAVEAGKAATAPADPTRDGYVFVGWDKSFANVTENLIITAQYQKEADKDSTIFISNASAAPGATEIQIIVSIENNPGVLGMTLKLTYDESALTLTSVKRGDALSELTFTTPKDLSSGCNFPWDGEEISPEDVTNGKILILTFSVKSSATAGQHDIVMSYDNGAIIDNDLMPLELNIVKGYITVK